MRESRVRKIGQGKESVLMTTGSFAGLNDQIPILLVLHSLSLALLDVDDLDGRVPGRNNHSDGDGERGMTHDSGSQPGGHLPMSAIVGAM